MDPFSIGKSQSLREIVQKTGEWKDWSDNEAFRKLIDAKVGIEVTGQLYALTNKLGKVGTLMKDRIEDMVNSNKDLIDSQNKHSRKITAATWTLVMVAAFQLFTMILNSLPIWIDWYLKK